MNWIGMMNQLKFRIMEKLKNLFKRWWKKIFNKEKVLWLCVDKSGQEVMIFSKNPPHRMPQKYWVPYDQDSILEYDVQFLDDGYIEEHLGRKLTWEDDPVEFTPLIRRA